LPGGTLVVSRNKNLFPWYKKRLLDFGFTDVETTGEEKDSLNMVINEAKPRLVLMGSRFYQAGTPYMAGQLLKRFPKLNIAAVSLGEFPDSLAVWFIWRGVKSYVNLLEGIEEFYVGLEEIRQGKQYISPAVRRLMEGFPEWPETKDKVTRRHLEILILLCNGFIPEQIGNELHITGRTVSTRLNELYKMFHVNNREEMVAAAWGFGIVTGQDMCFYNRTKNVELLPEWAAIKLKTDRMNREQETKSKE
jgi:DNA-binding NarL/FixJ family response regulator